jgi:23S rRNA pseudouridine1911/1915/1917 synthase
MNIPILFEDDAMIAVNKPPGIVVNNAESVKGDTIQDWAAHYLLFPRRRESALSEVGSVPVKTGIKSGMTEYDHEKEFNDRAGIVHRIDKETSGILLIAKTLPAFLELQRQFKEHIIQKTYLAIAHGKLVPPEGEINAPVGRLPWNKEHFGIVPGGKESITRYRVLGVIPGLTGNDKEYSLVELYPQSGRTHQIRVHLKYINHPIVADYLYAGRKTARDDRTWAPRVMLHAWKLVCLHPITQKELAFEAPIPDDMNAIINLKTQ